MVLGRLSDDDIHSTLSPVRLNAFDVTDDCEVHCASILSRPSQSGMSTFVLSRGAREHAGADGSSAWEAFG